MTKEQHGTGRWTLTIQTPLEGKVNVRFASESAARAYKAELEEKNAELDQLIYEHEGDRITYSVWYDPAANPSVNIPTIPSTSGANRSLRDVLAAAEPYDPSDF